MHAVEVQQVQSHLMSSNLCAQSEMLDPAAALCLVEGCLLSHCLLTSLPGALPMLSLQLPCSLHWLACAGMLAPQTLALCHVVLHCPAQHNLYTLYCALRSVSVMESTCLSIFFPLS